MSTKSVEFDIIFEKIQKMLKIFTAITGETIVYPPKSTENIYEFDAFNDVFRKIVKRIMNDSETTVISSFVLAEYLNYARNIGRKTTFRELKGLISGNFLDHAIVVGFDKEKASELDAKMSKAIEKSEKEEVFAEVAAHLLGDTSKEIVSNITKYPEIFRPLEPKPSMPTLDEKLEHLQSLALSNKLKAAIRIHLEMGERDTSKLGIAQELLDEMYNCGITELRYGPGPSGDDEDLITFSRIKPEFIDTLKEMVKDSDQS